MSKIGKRSSIYISTDLHSAGQKRLEALGYESFSNYVVGLIRADLVTLPAHELPMKIGNLGTKARDRIDAAMLQQTYTAPLMAEEENTDRIIDIAAAYRNQRMQPVQATGRRVAQ